MTYLSRQPNSLFAALTTILVLTIGFGCSGASSAAQPDADAILQLMLTSHENWSTLTGETLTTWHSPTGEKELVVTNFAIVNPDRSRFEMPDLETILISTGQSVYESYDNGDTYTQFRQQDANQLLGMLPTSPDEISHNEVYRHPIAMSIASPIVDYIFPVGMTQGLGAYEVIGQEAVIGRETWVVTLQQEGENGVITANAKYWVDQALGIILKAEVYSTNPDRLGQLFEEMAFHWIKVNPEIPDETFIP